MLTRELHIVQPKLVGVMGNDTLRLLNEIEFPSADALEPRLGELQRFTLTIGALVVPDIGGASPSMWRTPPHPPIRHIRAQTRTTWCFDRLWRLTIASAT